MENPIIIINAKRNAGYTAFLLGFNTEDRYYEGDSKCPPLSLRLSVAAKFPDHDVGYYSLSTGLMPLNRPDSRKAPFPQAVARSIHWNRSTKAFAFYDPERSGY
jgi:hypothetical protein